MLDFGSLGYNFAEDRDGSYSFVGIKSDGESKEKKLYLPLGFKPGKPDALEYNSYSTKKDLFFLLYRALRKYTGRLKQFEKKKQSKGDRDGAGEGATTNTFSIDTDEGTEEIVYTRFSGLDDVLDGYDELRLFAMRERMRRSDKIDYSNIHRYLDKAVYLPDDTIFIDEVEVPKPTLGRHTTDLVRMYCYIYSEIKRQMDESDDISPEVAAEAENFHEEHLAPTDALFNEESHTGDILRDQLERIDEQTAFKDDAYWHFYESIEAVLYPQRRVENSDGIHWGINNFCFVWEDMCQEKLAADTDFKVLYADRIDGISGSAKEDIQPALNLTTSNQQRTINLKPDAIVKFSPRFTGENFEFRVHSYIPKAKSNEVQKSYAAIQCLRILTNETSGSDVSWFCSAAPRNPEQNEDWKGWTRQTPSPPSFLILKKTDGEAPYDIVGTHIYRPTDTRPFERIQWTQVIPNNYGTKQGCYIGEKSPLLSTMGTYQDLALLQHSTSWLCIMAMRAWDKQDECIKKYFRLIDFKYKNTPSVDDYRKQLVYELALRKGCNAIVQNVLVMPGEDTKEAGTLKMDGKYKGIWLVTWNARETLESYIGRHQV